LSFIFFCCLRCLLWNIDSLKKSNSIPVNSSFPSSFQEKEFIFFSEFKLIERFFLSGFPAAAGGLFKNKRPHKFSYQVVCMITFGVEKEVVA